MPKPAAQVRAATRRKLARLRRALVRYEEGAEGNGDEDGTRDVGLVHVVGHVALEHDGEAQVRVVET